MKYFVADSYKSFEWNEEDIFVNNGKSYVKAKEKCDRCGGSGVFACRVENGSPVPHPAYNGVCLKCNGVGTVNKVIRIYTEKEKLALDKAAARRKENAEKAEAERIEKLNAASEENKKIWLAKNNFNKDGYCYSVVGEDTYSIKEELKELGCRFNPVLGWYSANELELSEDFQLLKVSFDDIYTWNATSKTALFKENCKEIMQNKIAMVKGPSKSEYMEGGVGDRFRNITAVFKSVRGFSGAYGYTNIYTFTSGDNVIVWFTTAIHDELEKGDVVDLSATIKKFEEFRGVKTTQVTRCKIKRIGA